MPRIRLFKPEAIVCDIEGTTTSIRFWQSVLAPFVLDNLASCLSEWWDRQECDDVIQVMRLNAHQAWTENEEHTMPLICSDDKPRQMIIDSVLRNVNYQLRQKHRNNLVKPIIMLVWLYGYETDKLKGHVYRDVAMAFTKWHQNDIKLFTYASGYRLAQEMLLCRSLNGNLHSMIQMFFDADHQGRKNDPASYRKIARDLKITRSCILFLSDRIDELKAAKKAGCTAVLVIRTHNQALKKQKNLQFQYIERFTELEFFV